MTEYEIFSQALKYAEQQVSEYNLTNETKAFIREAFEAGARYANRKSIEENINT